MNDVEWAAQTEHRSDTVTASAARALHDLLDGTGAAPIHGAELPPLWHWLAFLSQARQQDLGQDGHPATGGFLPPMHGRRRMHGGGQLDLEATVHVGERLQRNARVTAVQTKPGRSGELTVVTVTAEITSATGRIRERTDLVYREATPPASSLTPPTSRATADPAEQAGGWEIEHLVRVEPTLLFRFSALTYNAHRIHYDRDYATGQEGYPGLVVHGPLQAVLLAHLVDKMEAGRSVRQFRYRADAPAFDTADLILRARKPAADEVELAAFSSGVRTMSATAKLEPRWR